MQHFSRVQRALRDTQIALYLMDFGMYEARLKDTEFVVAAAGGSLRICKIDCRDEDRHPSEKNP